MISLEKNSTPVSLKFRENTARTIETEEELM